MINFKLQITNDKLFFALRVFRGDF